MKILFLTLVDFSSYGEHNIYCDLLRAFTKNGEANKVGRLYNVIPSDKGTCICI